MSVAPARSRAPRAMWVAKSWSPRRNHVSSPYSASASITVQVSPTTPQPRSSSNVPVLLGSPEAVADAIRPYRELGFGTVIVRMPAPYDPETIARMPGVWELLRS